MEKIKHVILILAVLFINACSNQQVKPQIKNEPVSTIVKDKKNTIKDEADIVQDDKSQTITPVKPTPDIEPSKKEGVVQKVIEKEHVNQTQNIEKSVVKSPTKEKPEEKEKEISPKNETIKTKPVESKPVKIVKKENKPYVNFSGKISLNTDKVKEKDVEIQSTVIYFKPDNYKAKTLSAENYKIASQNKRFVPSVLAIQKGSTVTFPNMDKILHNVFSVSNTQKFDLGLYSAGKEKTVTFENEGIVYVHCNVHHSMQADILVLDTPFYTNVNKNGEFSLENLPSKSGELYIWHPRAQLQKFVLNESSKAKNLNKTIDIIRKKIPKHLNKFGESYRPKRSK